jgi:hypothetical protein
MMKKEWKKAIVAIGIMLILSPLFAWAADKVGYAEPLEKAAEHLGVEEHATISIFPDYTIPGADPYASALIAGIFGCIVVLLVCLWIGKALR